MFKWIYVSVFVSLVSFKCFYLGVITCEEPVVITINGNFTASSSGIVCNTGKQIIIDQVKTHLKPHGDHGYKAFTDTSSFSNKLFDLCSLKRYCDLGKTFIEGFQYTQWIAEVTFSCKNEGKLLYIYKCVSV